jgi:hypothetical protein
VIHYAYHVHNTGSLALTGVTLDATRGNAEVRQTDFVGDGDNMLEVGEIWYFTNTATVTQAELNAGASLFNQVIRDRFIAR